MNCFQLYFFINLTNYLNIILIKINFKLLIFIKNQKNKYYQKKYTQLIYNKIDYFCYFILIII